MLVFYEVDKITEHITQTRELFLLVLKGPTKDSIRKNDILIIQCFVEDAAKQIPVQAGKAFTETFKSCHLFYLTDKHYLW